MRRLVSSPQLVVVAYALALLTIRLDWPRFLNPNEASRLYLLEAVMDHGTLAIDEPLARHGDMEDKLVVAGRSYSNKPPGLALLALPGYAAARALAWLFDRPLERSAALYAARLIAVSLPSILLMLALARRITALGLSNRSSAALLAAVAFGTGMFPYGTTLMAHATAASLLGLAAIAFSREPERPRDLWLGALACGVAGACEYPAAIPGAVLLCWAVLRAPSRLRLGWLALGLAAPVALVLGYNTMVFGSPFDLGYGHHVNPGFAEIHGRGLMGFQLPAASALLGLLLSASRGLFAWSPILLLAVPAMRMRGLRLALAVAVLAQILFIAGYPNWHGGWAVGPRYLLAIVPLLVLLAAAGVRQSPWLEAWLPGLAAASIALHGIATATFPFFPDLADNPLRSLALPLARSGVLGIAPVAFSLIALGIALRPRALHGLALASVFVAAVGLAREQGPLRFIQGEVTWLAGRDDLARTHFEGLLQKERASAAMAAHVRARLEAIYRADGSAATPGPAGSNMEDRSQPAR